MPWRGRQQNRAVSVAGACRAGNVPGHLGRLPDRYVIAWFEVCRASIDNSLLLTIYQARSERLFTCPADLPIRPLIGECETARLQISTCRMK